MFNFIIKSLMRCVVLLLVSAGAFGLVDPTQPATYTAGPAVGKKLRLESILVSDERKVAVINGKILSEGGEISGAIVISINDNSVRVRKKGRILNLVLDSVSIRQEK